MASDSSAIRPLPTNTVDQIRSSITITSLNGVVIELLKNSLDAQSHRVDISVDYPRGSCTVEDDGFGIRPAEFKDDGGLGKINHTSKHESLNPVHGGSGVFIFSLAALALVQITSRHQLYNSLNSLCINRSQVIARLMPAAAHQNILSLSHGTRVVVCDLFGNMPVRIKQRADVSRRSCGNDKEWEELRRLAAGLKLSWPNNLAINIRDIASNRRINFRGLREPESQDGLHEESALVSHVCSTLSQVMLISSPEQSKWISVNASTRAISIQGVISLEPAPTKAIQFISLGIRPLTALAGYNLLYEEINQLFKNSSFGAEGEMLDLNELERKRRSEDTRYKTDGFTQKELKGTGKGVDRWPMFFIRLESLDIAPNHIRAQNIVDSEPGFLSSAVELLRVMLLEFLQRHHFRPTPRRRLDSIPNLHPQNTWNTSVSSQIHSTIKNKGSHAIRQKPASEHSKLSPTTSSKDKNRGSKSYTSSKSHSISLAQDRKAVSLFNAWSRIKSGKRHFIARASERPYKSKRESLQQESEILGSCDGTIQCRSVSSAVHAIDLVHTPSTTVGARNLEGRHQYDLPKITKSGQLSQSPFEEFPSLELVVSNSKRVAGQGASSISNERKEYDSVRTWMNPITKKNFIVSNRTGLVVPSATVGLTEHSYTSIDQSVYQEKDVFPNHNGASSLWIDDILQNWTNPVFCPGEAPIPMVGVSSTDIKRHQVLDGSRQYCSQFEIDRAIQAPSVPLSNRISKWDLRQAQVISQVDKKFILVKLASRGSYSEQLDKDPLTETLILVDQHAADERCRIEDLFTKLCTPPSQTSESVGLQQAGILTSALEKPLHFTVSQRETNLFSRYSQHFINWGIVYELFPPVSSKGAQTGQKIIVRSLPPVIIEKCKLAPKLLIELLRSEAWKCYDKGGMSNTHGQVKEDEQFTTKGINTKNHPIWLKKIHGCPQGILDMLTSRSCRSAIMFNDDLSNDQCRALLSRLAECAFPFQCAHGRPSMIPLVDLGIFHEQKLKDKYENLSSPQNFALAFKDWNLRIAAPADERSKLPF